MNEEAKGRARELERGRDEVTPNEQFYIAFHATFQVASIPLHTQILRTCAALIPHPAPLHPATLCHAKSFVPFTLENCNFNYNFCFSLERTFIVPPPGLTGRRWIRLFRTNAHFRRMPIVCIRHELYTTYREIT